MTEVTLPFAKSIDEITHSGVYRTPKGIAFVAIGIDKVKQYSYGDPGLDGVIFVDGRHYIRKYENGGWSAWELKK